MWKVVKVALITPLGPEYMIKALDDDLIISVYEEELREITHRVIETETDLLCELYG